MFDLFPERASNFAIQVDLLYIALILLSAAFAIPIIILIIYFSVKYRRGTDAERANPHLSVKLEIAWIVIPLILAMGMFTAAAVVYFNMFTPPDDTLEITAVGRQWMWKFQHPDGQREINELHLPVGQPIRLTMISQDVIHSFYVPAFRVKQDVLPGRYSVVWFEPTQTGEYHLFCAEYCGALHADMIGRVVVMDPSLYQAWLDNGGVAAAEPELQGTPADAGEQLFTQLGCSGCHTMEGGGVGPSLVGVFGEPVELESGETVIADADYIRESIVMPNAKIVEGYEPLMPSYQGQVDEEQILQLVEYIESLGATEGTGEAETGSETQAPQENGD